MDNEKVMSAAHLPNRDAANASTKDCRNALLANAT